MTIEGLITIAKSSVLKGVAVKKDTESIIGFINLGLIELYKRFPLEVKEHIIALESGVTTYTMPSDFMWAISAYDEVPADSAADYILVPINVEDNPYSINSVSWNKFQVPLTTSGSFISMIYAAAPDVVTAVEDTLPVPPQLVEALLLYIGYLGNEGVDGDTPTSKGAAQYSKFEISCERVEMKGMFTTDDLEMGDRIYDRGFR